MGPNRHQLPQPLNLAVSQRIPVQACVACILSLSGWIGCILPQAEKLLIARIRARAARRRGVATGIGDDCAILQIPAGHQTLVTTDFSLEGIHFRREWHPPEIVGHRCLTRGLSDIAAMGGIPVAAFLSLALPQNLPQAWVDRFVKGSAQAGG